MKEQQLQEEIKERYELSLERIGQIGEEETVAEPFRSYFRKTAEFLKLTAGFAREVEEGRYGAFSLEELRRWNHRLYEDILPENYEESYGNPAYAVKCLGEDYGRLLCFLYAELRGQIPFAAEGRFFEITILNELFVEVYNQFEGQIPPAKSVEETLYWFESDYADSIIPKRLRETLDPSEAFGKEIVMEADLSDLRYLYQYGEYVSPEEEAIAAFLNGLPQETIDRMADTYTEGYRKGFLVTGVSLEGKKTVQVLFELGFERMVRKAVENFRKMGLEPVIYRQAVWSMDRMPNRKRGIHGTSPNNQYDYDHRYDEALYLRKAFTDRKLGIRKVALEELKKEAAAYGGPALIETFGEPSFQPVNKPEAYALSKKQEELSVAYANENAQLANEYMPGDKTSFTIIAFPKPSIGPDFPEIFSETIRINTLDYEVYKIIQQNIIDRLDQAEYVVITGAGENHTNLRVRLHKLEDRDSQTNFENCVADVNIPLGEVFTSPVLAATEGVLEVSSVYIGGIQFQELHMEFEDGRTTVFSCKNFEDPEEGRALIKQVILKNHDSLPMGEFAIGTNTVAYAMAQRFGIIDKLPILIVEKMGPHFAVGDTCYSWAEDKAVYNPNGKEIIARDNEVSILRKEDLSKAYLNCHTDITIPYREIGEIYGVTEEGEKLPIIAEGRFVVPGTEMLNEPLGF